MAKLGALAPLTEPLQIAMNDGCQAQFINVTLTLSAENSNFIQFLSSVNFDEETKNFSYLVI